MKIKISCAHAWIYCTIVCYVVFYISLYFMTNVYLCVVCGIVSLLRDLKHANIVTLHDIIHTDSCLTLVFEYLVRIATFIISLSIL